MPYLVYMLILLVEPQFEGSILSAIPNFHYAVSKENRL